MLKRLNNKTLAIKVEEGIYSYAIHTSNDGIVNLRVNYDNVHNYYVQLPKGDWVVVGYSHQLTDTQISSLGLDSKEYKQLLDQNDVKYNYTSWQGKWLVLFNRE